MLLNLASSIGLKNEISRLYCEKAQKFTITIGYNDAYKWTSSSYYNLAGSFMTHSKFHEASECLEISVEMHLEYKGSEKESLFELELQLAKRYEILGICHIQLKNDEVISSKIDLLSRLQWVI